MIHDKKLLDVSNSWHRDDRGVLGDDSWHPAEDVTGDQDHIMDIRHPGTPGGGGARGHQPGHYDAILTGPHDDTSISLKLKIIKHTSPFSSSKNKI